MNKMKYAGGWNTTEIVTMLVMLCLIGGGVYSLFHARGLAGGLKWLGVLLVIVVSIVALLAWKNERDNRILKERLQALREERDRDADTG